MFDTDAGRDDAAVLRTRRSFVAGAAAVTAGFAAMWVFRSPGVEASMEVHGTPGEVKVVQFKADGSSQGKVTLPKIVKTDGEWYQQLGANSFGIARQGDTEMPYSGVSWKEHRDGLYRCVCCDLGLFSSKTKFESGTGWPSFWAPLAKENVAEHEDRSLSEVRTEVRCALCDGHLGHVFSDGPEPTGLRYCMNSASMVFRPFAKG